jgi:hypothetical protein
MSICSTLSGRNAGESVSPVLPTDDGSTLRIRKAATPELEVENLYRALGIPSQIAKPQHRWTPQLG